MAIKASDIKLNGIRSPTLFGDSSFSTGGVHHIKRWIMHADGTIAVEFRIADGVAWFRQEEIDEYGESLLKLISGADEILVMEE